MAFNTYVLPCFVEKYHYIYTLLYYTALIDIGLGLFNLIPIAGVNYSDDLCCGLSGAAGPDGNWIARTDGQEEIILYADIDDTAALTMREKIPYYEDLGSWEMEELLKLCRKLEAEK